MKILASSIFGYLFPRGHLLVSSFINSLSLHSLQAMYERCLFWESQQRVCSLFSSQVLIIDFTLADAIERGDWGPVNLWRHVGTQIGVAQFPCDSRINLITTSWAGIE